ncbi:uncharacterized protein LOC142345819 isoform X3 [Convolutriloba macropyga]|uniref:uncharacterized protein LOC142345819 isoform X3 n=1 Tax=Convolutriloba macropyga TaxID=536237 RepID=UPI003F520FFB
MMSRNVDFLPSPDSSFSNLSTNMPGRENNLNDSLCTAELSSKLLPLHDSIESNLDIILTDDEVHSDREFYRRESRNDDSSEQFYSPDMRPIGGNILQIGSSRQQEPAANDSVSKHPENISLLSSIASNNASICEDTNIDGVDLGATSDENFAVEDKMFHKNAVKDSAKLIENLKIENFNLKLRIYYFEQESSLTDKDVRIQQTGEKALEYIFGEESKLGKNVNLHVERDQLREKIQEKERLLNDAKKVIGTFSKDDSMMKSERATHDRELSKLKHNYELSLTSLKKELGKKDDEIEKLKTRLNSHLPDVHTSLANPTTPTHTKDAAKTSLSQSGLSRTPSKCNTSITRIPSPSKGSKSGKFGIEALEAKLEKANKELESRTKELETKTRIMSAYEEKLARIEAEHMSCSDTEAAARATTESQLKTVSEERDQLKRSLRGKERDWSDALDQVEQLHKQMNDKALQIQQLQSELRRSEDERERRDSAASGDREQLREALRDKADLEEKITVLEGAMKDGVNHSVIYQKWKEEVRELQSQIDDVNLNLKCKTVELENCLKDKQKLEAQLETSEAKLRENNYERKRLTEEVAALQKNLEEVEKKSSEQKYSINSLLKENSKAAMEKEDLKEQIQDLKNDLDRSARSLNDAETKNRQLEREKGSQGENLDKIKKEIANLQTKLKRLESENQAKDLLLTDSEQKVKDLKAKLVDEEDNMEELKAEIDKLKSLENEKEKLETKVYFLEKDLNLKEDQISDRDKTIDDLQSTTESLGRNLTNLETENSCVKLDLEKNNDLISDLKSKLAESQNQMDEIETELKSKEKLLNQASKDLANKEHLVNSTITESALLKTQIDSFKSQLLSANRRIEELEAAKYELEQLVLDKEKEMQLVKQKSQEDSDSVDRRLNENNRELEFAYDKITQLEKADKDKISKIEKLKFDMQEKENEKRMLKSDLEDERNKNDNLEKEIESLTSNNSVKSELIDNLEQEKQQIDRDLTVKCAALSNEIDALKTANEKVERARLKAESDLENKDDELCNLLQRISKQDEKIDNLQNVKADFDSEKKRLNTKIRELESDKLKLNNHINELESDLEQAKVMLDNLKKIEKSAQSADDYDGTKRPVFKRERTLYPDVSDPPVLESSSLFENYHSTSDELKKLLVESNTELDASKQKVNDLEEELAQLKEQILRSEQIFDDMQEKLDFEKNRYNDLKASVAQNEKPSKKTSSVTFEECCQTDDDQAMINDYSQLYRQLSQLATVSNSGDGQNGTEASLADILALVEKITQKLQRYKTDNKAKDKQVKELRLKIEDLVRANDSSCNQSETASSISGFDVHINANEFDGVEADGAWPLFGRSESNIARKDSNARDQTGKREKLEKRDSKSKTEDADVEDLKQKLKEVKEELRMKNDELTNVKMEYEQFKIASTQKRADLSETVAQLKFTVRNLQNQIEDMQSQANEGSQSGVGDDEVEKESIESQWEKSEERMKLKQSVEDYKKLIEGLEKMVKKNETDSKKKDAVIKSLEEGCKDMETTFTSTVNSLQDLLETKDKAVQGLCDQLSKIKQERRLGRAPKRSAPGDKEEAGSCSDSVGGDSVSERDNDENVAATNTSATSESEAERERQLKHVNTMLKASQEELEVKMREMQAEHEARCRDLFDKLVDAEQSVENLSTVLSTRQKELNQLTSENTRRRFGNRYKERVKALEEQMKSTSSAIDNVLHQQQQTSPRLAEEEVEDNDHASRLNKHRNVQMQNINVSARVELDVDSSSQADSECRDVDTQTNRRKKEARGDGYEDDEPIIRQLESYRLQLLAAESDYKLLNEKFIAMKSVLSLQAEKIRVQRQLLKATVNSHTGSSPAGGDEGLRSLKNKKSSNMPHRLDSFELSNDADIADIPGNAKGHSKQKKTTVAPRASVSPPRRGAGTISGVGKGRDKVAASGSSVNPLAKSNTSEHDTSRHSLSREGTKHDLMQPQMSSTTAAGTSAGGRAGATGLQSRSTSMLELRSGSKRRGGKDRHPKKSSNRSHGEESEESEGRAKGHRLSHHPEEDEDNNDEMLSDADEVGPEEQLHNVQQLSRSPAKYDSDNVHMPNIGDLMFEVQRLTKLMKSHDTNTLKMLREIKGSHGGASGEVECHDSSGSGAQALRSETEPSQHTPPTKDTDFSFSTKENDGKDAMRELMRLSLNSGLLSSNDHQSLIARIQTQFSRDTNLIENLKLDLKKQVEDNDDLKECLGHLTTASKRLEDCLDQSLQIVQCIVSESLNDRLSEAKLEELKRSLAHLNDHKSILNEFNANPNVSKASRTLFDQVGASKTGWNSSCDSYGAKYYPSSSSHHATAGSSDHHSSIPIESMCEQNRPRMAALMNDNKRLVEILERKDAEIDYLLRSRKSAVNNNNPTSAVPPIGSGASGDSGSMRYESEHKRDREKERERDTAASERVCMLTDKLTKLLDENKQLKQCIRGLDNRVTNTTSTAGVDPTSCKGSKTVPGFDSGLVIGTTFTLFHQLRDQISDARILAKTASVRLKDRLDCGPPNLFSPKKSACTDLAADIPLLGSLSRDVTSVAKILEVCQNFLLKFKRVYFDQITSSIHMSSYTGTSGVALENNTTAAGSASGTNTKDLLVNSGNERSCHAAKNGISSHHLTGTLGGSLLSSHSRNNNHSSSGGRDVLSGHQLFLAAKNKSKANNTHNSTSATTANNNSRLSSYY